MSGSSTLDAFAEEARELIGQFTSSLLMASRGGDATEELVGQMFRACHSLKGNAGLAEVPGIEQVAHAMEESLEVVREAIVRGELRAADNVLDDTLVDLLLAGADRVLFVVDDLHQRRGMDSPDVTGPLGRWVAQRVGAEDGQEHEQGERVADAVIAATREEFVELSPELLGHRPGGKDFVYGIKLDVALAEKVHQVSPLEVAARIERAGAVLSGHVEPVATSLERALPSGPLPLRAIVASDLPADEFVKRLDLPFARVIELKRLEPAVEVTARSPETRVAATSTPVQSTVVTHQALPRASSLRVSVPLIDRMMSLAGELVLVRNQALRTNVNPGGEATSAAKLREVLRRLDLITNDLQDAALRMRMQPVSQLFETFPRVIRDIARQLDKQIDLDVSGGEVELDKTLLELLSDPLTHLVRNCCDHGIELPDERAARGKPPTGTIKLSARQQRGQIVIEIADDGKGVDVARVREKAIERGLKRADELDSMEQSELVRLILLPGLSTAGKVTELSGRGVGMDVVRTNIEQLGGSLEIESVPGQSTRFLLRLPLTLAIIPGLLISSGDVTFALPQRDVDEVLMLSSDQRKRARIEAAGREEFLRLRNDLIPLVRMDRVVGTTARTTPTADSPVPDSPVTNVVVLRFGSTRFALAVDRVLNTEEIVAKPIHSMLKSLTIYSGATILGDGRVAMILSSEGLGRFLGLSSRVSPSQQAQTSQEDEAQRLLLLRCGSADLLALPVGTVRRVLMVSNDQIKSLGQTSVVEVDGQIVELIRPEKFLPVGDKQMSEQAHQFVVMPRRSQAARALVVTQVIGTVDRPVTLDTQTLRVDGVLGVAMVDQQPAVLLDFHRLLDRAAGIDAAPQDTKKAPSRVLVVDDTQFFRQLETTYLVQLGCTVVTANDGRQAVELLQRDKSFDLVISDLEMPRLDGFGLARAARSMAFKGPMLACSTLSDPQSFARAKAAGFDRQLVKLDRDEFLGVVNELLIQNSKGVA